MGSVQEIKNKALQAAGNQPSQEAQSFDKQIRNLLGNMSPAIRQVLPKQFDSERFARIALSEVRRNPQLANCSLESIGGALMQSAIVGVEIGVNGLAYMVPRWNSKFGRLDAEFQLGYKGYIALAHRTGDVATIDAEIVYEDDHFDFQFGTKKFLIHKPNIESEKYGDPQYAKKYYCIIKFKDGSEQFKVITKKQAEAHMQRMAPKNKQQQIVGPWKSDFDAMALKTAIRWLFKTVHINTEFSEHISRDETIANDPDNPQSVYNVIDAEETEVTDKE